MENPCPAANLWLDCLLLGTRHPAPSLPPNPFKQGSLLPPAGPLGSAPQTRDRCAQLAGRRPRLLTAHARQKSGRATLQNLSTSLSAPQSPLSSPRERICGGTSPNLRLQSLRLRERSLGGDRLSPSLPFAQRQAEARSFRKLSGQRGRCSLFALTPRRGWDLQTQGLTSSGAPFSAPAANAHRSRSLQTQRAGQLPGVRLREWIAGPGLTGAELATITTICAHPLAAEQPLRSSGSPAPSRSSVPSPPPTPAPNSARLPAEASLTPTTAPPPR